MATAAGSTTRLWTLVAKEMWRKARRRLRAGPVYRWRYSGRTPERVLIAPPDLRLADPQIALEIYYGRFPLSGHLVETGGRSPFQIEVQNRGWLKTLHGFRWLRHMRAAGTELAAANARALVSDWIVTHGGSISGVAWEPATTAKRIIAWLQHSSVVLQGAEFPFYRAYLKSLAVQIRYLRSVVKEMPDGKDRLRARIALAFAALSLPAPASALRSATRHLAEELDRQILPDGGHISRNPLTVMELLADLLPLRYTYANQAETPPAALINAVDRMLPALRFFRHEDGALARFNGMGATIHDRIAAILRHDDTEGAPLLHAPHSGYERLSMGGTTVIADTGLPPPIDVSNAAHAGCLSFEMSSGRQHFIVNCGVDTYGAAEFRPLARATAAHSTATLNDTSSARFNHSIRVNDMDSPPLIGGPRHVPCRRTDQPGSARLHRQPRRLCRALLALSRARAFAVFRRQRARRHRPLPALGRRGGAQQRPRLRDHPLPPASRRRAVPRRGRAAGADGAERRPLGDVLRRGCACHRGIDLFRRPRRSEAQPPDRARLQGVRLPGGPLAADPHAYGGLSAEAVTACSDALA